MSVTRIDGEPTPVARNRLLAEDARGSHAIGKWLVTERQDGATVTLNLGERRPGRGPSERSEN